MDPHHEFDNFTDQWLADYQSANKNIYCQSGCSACCRLAVHATFPEANAIAAQLSAQQAETLNAYILRLKERLSDLHDLKVYLRQHRQSIGPCPFLDRAGDCSIYALRPLACRALLSTKPADWCAVDFSALDEWDKQVFANSLDRQVVAWPTHYVLATQDFARRLEQRILEQMQNEYGWRLSGNLSVMTWLEKSYQFSKRNLTLQQVETILSEHRFDNPLLLSLC